MKTISQRELRNNSGEVMRGLERGESYRVTNRGKQVGVLIPSTHDDLEELTLRPPAGAIVFPSRVRIGESSEDVLRELRGDR